MSLLSVHDFSTLPQAIQDVFMDLADERFAHAKIAWRYAANKAKGKLPLYIPTAQFFKANCEDHNVWATVAERLKIRVRNPKHALEEIQWFCHLVNKSAITLIFDNATLEHAFALDILLRGRRPMLSKSWAVIQSTAAAFHKQTILLQTPLAGEDFLELPTRLQEAFITVFREKAVKEKEYDADCLIADFQQYRKDSHVWKAVAKLLNISESIDSKQALQKHYQEMNEMVFKLRDPKPEDAFEERCRIIHCLQEYDGMHIMHDLPNKEDLFLLKQNPMTMPTKVQEQFFDFLGTSEMIRFLQVSKRSNKQTRRFLGDLRCTALYAGIQIGAAGGNPRFLTCATHEDAFQAVKHIHQAAIGILVAWLQTEVKGFDPQKRQLGLRQLDKIAQLSGWRQWRTLARFLEHFQPLDYAVKELKKAILQNYAPCGLCSNDVFYFDFWLARSYKQLLKEYSPLVIDGVKRLFIRNLPNIKHVFEKYENRLVTCKNHTTPNVIIKKPLKVAMLSVKSKK